MSTSDIVIEEVTGHRDRLPRLQAAIGDDIEHTREEIRRFVRAALDLLRKAEDRLDALRCEAEEDSEGPDEDEVRAAEEFVEACHLYVEEASELGAEVQLQISELQRELATDYQFAADWLNSVLEKYEDFRRLPVPGGGSASRTGTTKAGWGDKDGMLSGPLPILPGNLQWMALEDLDWDAAQADIQFKNAPRHDIEFMMRRFANEIVPLLRSNPRLSRDDLVNLDNVGGGATGRDAARTLAFAWDCMLGGQDLIVLDRARDGSGARPGWTSGRHRALVARDLGWTHLPARVI